MDASRPPWDNQGLPPSLRVLLAGLLFATGGAAIKLSDLPALQRAALRAGVAAAALFAMLPEARRWPSAAMLRLVLPYFGATVLFVVANSLTTAANAIFLQSTAIVWLLGFGGVVPGERAARRDLGVLAAVGCGLVLCFLAPPAVQSTAPNPRAGDWLAFASGFSYALLLLGMRWLARVRPDETCAAIAWSNLASLPLALAAMSLLGQTPVAGGPRDWLVIAYLGTVQVGFAYLLLVRGLAQVPAMRASLLLMIEPALSPAIAWLVHGELPHPLVAAGGAIIMAAVAAGALLADGVRR